MVGRASQGASQAAPRARVKNQISEALAAVRREQRYQEVCRELQDMEEKIRTSTFKLDSFLWELARVPQDLHKLVS